MRENAVSIIKRRPLGGTIDFRIQQCKRYHSSRCKNSRDSYKVCVWLATGIRKFLDTANCGSSRQYVIAGLTPNAREHCVFEHVRELRNFSITA